MGLHLAQVAKVVNRAFDDALARAGGSLPVWLVLIALKSRQSANQRQLADAVGIQGPTLTHHLNAMESAGLLTRRLTEQRVTVGFSPAHHESLVLPAIAVDTDGTG